MGGRGAANGGGRHVLLVDAMAKGGVCCRVYGVGVVVYTGQGLIISEYNNIYIYEYNKKFKHFKLPQNILLVDQVGCNCC